jgi:hypothetical protein
MASDAGRLQQMHALQGFHYGLPDLNDPVFVGKWCLEEIERSGGQEVKMAIMARLTAEIYMLHDPTEGTPQERWLRFIRLHGAGEANIARMGIREVHAFLPPEVERAFGRRLVGLGWYKEPWNCYTLELRHLKFEIGDLKDASNDQSCA